MTQFVLGRLIDFLFHFAVHVLEVELLDHALQSTEDLFVFLAEIV